MNDVSEKVKENLFERLELSSNDWRACHDKRSSELESNMLQNTKEYS
jgi:hypothetical protein